MKTAFFVAPEPNRLSCACAVRCPYSLTPTEWTTWGNNTSWRRKTLIFTFEWTGESLKPIAFPWKCHRKHIMEHCDEYNNCPRLLPAGLLPFEFALCFSRVCPQMWACSQATTVVSFSSMQKKSWEIFNFLWFYTTSRPHCDVTSHLICVNQNLE